MVQNEGTTPTKANPPQHYAKLLPAFPRVAKAWHIAAFCVVALLTLGLALTAWKVSGHELVRVGTIADRDYLVDGFYEVEQNKEFGVYRWTQPVAYLILPDWGPGDIHVTISGVGAGMLSEAVLSISGTPLNHVTIEPGKPWSIEAWGVTSSRNPTVTLDGPQFDAPGDARTLGRLVTSLDIFSPGARFRALVSLAMLALTSILLYATFLFWYGRPALALIAMTALLALIGPLVVYRDRWAEVVTWAAPLFLLLLLLADRITRRAIFRVGHPGRWSALLACVALTAALSLLAQGFLNAFDSERMYQMAAGLAEYGLPTRYPGRETWTKYGFGQSLISVPFYLLGKTLSLAGADIKQATIFTVSMTNIPVTVLTCWLLYTGAKRFTQTGVALMVAATYLLTTPALNYARTYFSEPAGAALLLAGMLLLLPNQEGSAPTRKRFVGAGACLGAMILFKPAFVCYWPVAGLMVLWLAYRKSSSKESIGVKWKDALLAGAGFSIGLLAAGVIQIAYNYLRYHGVSNSLFRTGYEREPGFVTPLEEGLFGLLFSPGKSIFLYAPVVLLAPVGLWLMYRRFGLSGRATTLFIVGQALVGIGFNALWWAWTGNFAWGPRLIMPILPLLVLPVATLGQYILDTRNATIARRWVATVATAAWVCLGVLGMVVSVPGALVDFQVFYRLHGLLLAGDPGEAATIYDPAQSPIVVEPGYLLDGLSAAIHRPSLANTGLPEIWDIIVPVTLTAIALVAAFAIRKPGADVDTHPIRPSLTAHQP